MARIFASLTAILIGAALMAAGARAEGYTTRIEPRPFYGATVTLEEGVRVIRPLPPERHVIINPGDAPVSLGFNETRVYENRMIRHYHEGGRSDGGALRGGVGYGGIGYGYGARGYGKGQKFPQYGYTGLNYGYGPAAGLGVRQTRRVGAPAH